jgi:hypothetical protein
MEVLNKINWLKPFQIDIFIYSLVLDGLFVLIKFFVPFLFIFGISLGIRTPVSHTEPRVCKSCIATDDNHTENSSSCHEEPTANEFLFAGLYELLCVTVLVETWLEKGRGSSDEWVECFSDNHVFVIFLMLLELVKIII